MTSPLLRGRYLLALWLLLAQSTSAAEPSVILISLDGTTPEAVQRAELDALGSLERRGAAAERLVPVFPTNTFPNHVTLVTGVAPERHGIVNNVFVDPQRGTYRYDSDPTWIEVEPLWSLAARSGVVSAAFHWVGSEGTWRSGLGPRHWRPFEASVPEVEKVDQILAWLDRTEPEERPRLITSWFRGADHVGHRHGPDSRQVSQALRRQDDALARLVRGLRQRRLLETTTLLVVSDHGMSAVTRVVDLEAALERDGVRGRVLGGGGFATVNLGGSERAERVLEIARRLGLEAHRRGEAPSSLRLAHPRFGDLVVLAPVGTAISRRGAATGLATRLVMGLLTRLGSEPLALRGAHGYPAEVPGMGALFVAAGRGVPPGTELGVVRAVDVAPTVLALLDLSVPSWMEGEPIAALVASRPPARRGTGSKVEETP